VQRPVWLQGCKDFEDQVLSR